MLTAPGSRITPSDVVQRSRPAPIKGMNTADMITSLDSGFAIRLDNWICRRDGLHVRNGFVVTADAGDAVTALLAHGNTVLPMTDGDWMGAMVSNPGARFLVAMDGVHSPKVHDGASWRTMTLSGVDPTKLVCPVIHGNRVMAIERGTMTVWYLGVDAIGGPASPIFAQMLARHGGELAALVSTGGSLLAVTDRGELIKWDGRNPATPEGWSHAGTFQVPAPVGRHCFAEMGAGVALLTVTGLLPVLQVLGAAQSGKEVASITSSIEPTLETAGATRVLDSGRQNLTLIACNGHQFVRSAETGGWSRLYGWNATSWVETPQALYFGRADGKVCKVDGWVDGETQPIPTVMIDSFSALGRQERKAFNRVWPHFKLAHPYTPRIELLTDYADPPVSWPSQQTNIASPHWLWSQLEWEITPALWRKPVSARRGQWRGVGGRGRTAALLMGCLIADGDAIFIGADYAYRNGAGL